MAFNPFGDFSTAGYLRNIEAETDLALVKAQEKVFFESHLEEALGFWRRVKGPITYARFRKVHGILFAEFYPWAGQDRQQLRVAGQVSEGGADPGHHPQGSHKAKSVCCFHRLESNMNVT